MAQYMTRVHCTFVILIFNFAKKNPVGWEGNTDLFSFQKFSLIFCYRRPDQTLFFAFWKIWVQT
jgi:hypothetical protein